MAAARATAAFLILAERNRIRLIREKNSRKLPKRFVHSSSPMVSAGRLLTEKSICMDVLVLSQPNKVFVVRIHKTPHKRKVTPVITRAASILNTAR